MLFASAKVRCHEDSFTTDIPSLPWRHLIWLTSKETPKLRVTAPLWWESIGISVKPDGAKAILRANLFRIGWWIYIYIELFVYLRTVLRDSFIVWISHLISCLYFVMLVTMIILLTCSLMFARCIHCLKACLISNMPSNNLLRLS